MGQFFILFLAVVIVLFAIMLASAPIGYEDKEGFHYGKEEDKWKS